MPKQGEKQGCKECRHFETKGVEGKTECHLHPPTVVVQHTEGMSTINSAFPFVHPNSWCNDWSSN
jgi:hypothetical protein